MLAALVRQVYAHRVFRPQVGEPGVEESLAVGLAKAGPVLAAINAIAAEGLVLDGARVTLADCLMAPMISCIIEAPEGEKAVRRHAALATKWENIRVRRSVLSTDPGKPG